MIERIIEWSLRNRFLVACSVLLLVALGIRAVRTTPVDAILDLTENQVLVYADFMGRGPQEVEDQVTYPLTSLAKEGRYPLNNTHKSQRRDRTTT